MNITQKVIQSSYNEFQLIDDIIDKLNFMSTVRPYQKEETVIELVRAIKKFIEIRDDLIINTDISDYDDIDVIATHLIDDFSEKIEDLMYCLRGSTTEENLLSIYTDIFIPLVDLIYVDNPIEDSLDTFCRIILECLNVKLF